MTQREMLEAAARAAGYLIESFIDDDAAWVYESTAKPNTDGEYPIFKWAPKIDDGDSMRLAVKLRMMIDDIHVAGSYMEGHVVAVVHGAEAVYEPREPDPYAATRLAIFRAAVAIDQSARRPAGQGETK